MDPNLYQQPQAQNPYDFLNTVAAKKQPLLSIKDPKQRMIVSVIFVASVLLIIGIGFAVFSAATKKDNSAYTTLLQKQTEILRIADLGMPKARDNATKNYITTLKQITLGESVDVTSYLKSSGVKVNEKTLAAKKDTNNDKIISAAEQTNQYDEKFVALVNSLVLDYQRTIKTLPTNSGNKTEKALVAELTNNAKVIANASSTK